MREEDSRPTLLVFTRGAEREARRRRLLPARLEPLEREVHHRCLASALAAGRAAGCALTVSSPTRLSAAPGIRHFPQPGSGFGERLRLALRRASSLRAGPVLVVGTDTPGLAPSHLRSAIAGLDRDPESVVLGPATDGGIYLLATRRPLDEVLASVTWKRRDTVTTLLAALAAAGIPVRLLEPLSDLDRPQDLARWASLAAREIWRPLLARVREALAALRRLVVPPVLGRPRSLAAALPLGRAPPPSI